MPYDWSMFTTWVCHVVFMWMPNEQVKGNREGVALFEK